MREHLLTHAIQVVFPIPGKNVKLEEELEAYMAAMVPVDEGFQVSRLALQPFGRHIGSSDLGDPRALQDIKSYIKAFNLFR